MNEDTERQIAHLAMIQAIVARLASNSLNFKMMAVTLSAGAIALIGSVQRPSILFFLAPVGAVVMFGWLDASYLRLERLYRRLYNDAVGGKVKAFDMDVDKYAGDEEPATRIALSWSVNAVYSTLLAVLIAVAIGVWRAN